MNRFCEERCSLVFSNTLFKIWYSLLHVRTGNIQWQHKWISKNLLGKKRNGHFSIQIQTGTYLTPAEKTWLTEIWSLKFQTNIKSEYHWQNSWVSCPCTFLPHISKSTSFCPLQSAHCKFLSTETALLKLTNDIIETIDSGKITILTALDMSAAFDTLDHITLLRRLQHTFGLPGYVILWIHSYLTDRSSFVKIDSSSSSSTTILTGVPQGSVLGPLLCPIPPPYLF